MRGDKFYESIQRIGKLLDVVKDYDRQEAEEYRTYLIKALISLAGIAIGINYERTGKTDLKLAKRWEAGVDLSPIEQRLEVQEVSEDLNEEEGKYT